MRNSRSDAHPEHFGDSIHTDEEGTNQPGQFAQLTIDDHLRLDRLHDAPRVRTRHSPAVRTFLTQSVCDR
jgi:hypothetical protein